MQLVFCEVQVHLLRVKNILSIYVEQLLEFSKEVSPAESKQVERSMARIVDNDELMPSNGGIEHLHIR